MSTLVIVGAGPGLGLSLAEKFGKKDFNVALIARNQDRLDTLQASLTDMNIKSAGFSADVTNEQQIADAFTQVRETFGQIDVLVYNAGVIAPVSAAETTADIANQHMQVNIIGGISSAQRGDSRDDRTEAGNHLLHRWWSFRADGDPHPDHFEHRQVRTAQLRSLPS